MITLQSDQSHQTVAVTSVVKLMKTCHDNTAE